MNEYYELGFALAQKQIKQKGRRLEEAPANGEVLTSTRKHISDDSYEYYKNLGVNFDRKNEGKPSSRSSRDWSQVLTSTSFLLEPLLKSARD
jgi:hypothetical protein